MRGGGSVRREGVKRVQRECGSVRAECEEGACEEGPEGVWKCESRV